MMAPTAVEYRCASAAEMSGWTRRPLVAWLGRRELAELGSWRDTARRAQWLVGRALAKEVVLDRFPIAGGDPTSVEVSSRDEHGRSNPPQLLIDGQTMPWSLSLAHTAQAAAIAICATPGHQVGIDLAAASIGRPLVSRWFTAAERQWLRRTRQEASLVWAAKEAVYKALASGEPFSPLEIEIVPQANDNFACRYRGLSLGNRCSLHAWTTHQHAAVLAIVRPEAHLRRASERSPCTVFGQASRAAASDR
jgi:phosphopantetheinyl transferase (holo-ACP synthase)